MAALEERIARERHYVGLAVPLLEGVLEKEDFGEENPIAMRYLLGELYRKQGRNDEEREQLKAVLAEPKAKDWVRGLAQRAMRKLPPPKDK